MDLMDKIIDLDEYRLWIFDYENEYFEKVRAKALEEDGWLKDNYQPEKFTVSDHVVIGILYDNVTNEPIGFGGLKEFTPDVVSMMHRFYLFPELRADKNPMNHKNGKIFVETLKAMQWFVETQTSYKLGVIHMQQRSAKKAGQQIWWKLMCKIVKSADERWTNYKDGLVQTYPGEATSCYQNLLYLELDDYTIEDWNPKTMSYDQHALRMEHEQLSTAN